MKRLLIVLLLLPVVVACGPKTKPILIKADTTIYLATKAIHETAVVLGTNGVLTPAEELRIQQAILPVAKLGEAATRAINAWTTGQPTPLELQNLVRALGHLTEEIVKAIPQKASAKAALLEKVSLAQQAVLVIVTIMVGGAS